MKLRNLLLGFGLIAGMAFGQEKSPACLDALALGYQGIETKDWNFAIEQYLVAFKECPAEKANYSNLLYAFNGKYDAATDATVKKNAADSMVMYYNQIFEKFGYDVLTGAEMASLLVKEKSTEYNRIDTLYSNYVNKNKENSYIAYTSNYYVNLHKLYSNEQDATKKEEHKTRILEDFLRLTEYLDKSNNTPEVKSQYTTYFEGYFFHVAKECSDILPVVKTKLANMPTDKEEKRKVVENYMALLGKKDCSKSDEYAALLKISVEELDPTPASMMAYGEYLYANGKKSEGITKMKEAIAMETDAANKSSMTFKVVQRIYNSGNYKKAFSMAKSVTGKDKGDALVIMAKCVASTASKCGSSTFERKSTYWLALDYLNKASAAGKSASSLKAKYCAAAPSLSEAFENGKQAGDSVSISCWGESTKVRNCK